MGGPEQGSPIIACGLCHLILTLCAQSLNAQTSVSSLGQRNDEAYDHGLDITKAVQDTDATQSESHVTLS